MCSTERRDVVHPSWTIANDGESQRSTGWPRNDQLIEITVKHHHQTKNEGETHLILFEVGDVTMNATDEFFSATLMTKFADVFGQEGKPAGDLEYPLSISSSSASSSLLPVFSPSDF